MLTSLTCLGTKSYTSFNMIKRLAADRIAQDTLFHSSIAAMLKNYGVTSTGLHGLVEIQYHVFSHWLYAGVSRLSGVSVFEVYGIIPFLFFIPLLLFSLSLATIRIADKEDSPTITYTWTLACVLLTATPIVAKNFGFFASYFQSESYIISLILLLTALPLLYKQKLSLPETISLCLLCIVMSLSKISVGLVYTGLWWARSLFFPHIATKKTLITTLLLSIVAIATFLLTSPKHTGIELLFERFAFIRDYSYLGKYIKKFAKHSGPINLIATANLGMATVSIILFIIFHYFISWIVICQSFVTTGNWKGVFKSPSAVYSLAAIGGTMIIIVLLNIPGGSAYYFSNIAFFVSLPICILFINDLLKKLQSNHKGPTKAIAIAGLCVLCFTPNCIQVKKIVKRHVEILGVKENLFIGELQKIANHAPLNNCYQPTQELLQTNPISRVTARPFVFPAVSEHPWVDMILDPKGQQYQYYGYEYYGLTPNKQTVTMPPKLTESGGVKLKITPYQKNTIPSPN